FSGAAMAGKPVQAPDRGCISYHVGVPAARWGSQDGNRRRDGDNVDNRPPLRNGSSPLNIGRSGSAVSGGSSLQEGEMAYSANRLPTRFPVGTKFVIEGRRGVYSRYLEFPDGTCVRLPKRGKRTARRRSRR